MGLEAPPGTRVGIQNICFFCPPAPEFELARAALRVSNTAHPVLPHVANKIIELAKAGERNPDLLCERAMTDLGQRHISTGGQDPRP
jgi:hypothetical protein